MLAGYVCRYVDYLCAGKKEKTRGSLELELILPVQFVQSVINYTQL